MKPVLSPGRARADQQIPRTGEKESRPGEPSLEENPAEKSVAVLPASVGAASTVTRTFFPRPGDIHGEGASIEGFAIHGLNGLLRLLGCAHGDKTEAARAASAPVHHQVCFRNRAVRGKRVLQVVFGGIEGKISNKQFIVHVMFCCTDSLLFPDCSRLSGLKSSLN